VHGRHVVRKRTRSLSFQTILNSRLTVFPVPVWSRQELDYFGNKVDLIEVLEPHDTLTVTALSDVEVGPRPIDTGLPLFSESWERVRDRLWTDPGCYEAREMQLDSPLVRRHHLLSDFGAKTFGPGRPLFDAVTELNRRIFEEFTYDPNFSDVATPLGKVLREKRGVCQDFAHLAVGVLRSLGLSARYVSGYLETRPPPGQARLIGADASHAWASVYFPDYGWVSFDPTNNMLPGERHIVVAWGRDFSEVSPLRGVVHGGGRHTVRVSVDVDPQILNIPASAVGGTPKLPKAAAPAGVAEVLVPASPQPGVAALSGAIQTDSAAAEDGSPASQTQISRLI
jgi:transglutaminase-like putative cysteine protease